MGGKRITNPRTKASKPKKVRRSARLATDTVIGAPSVPSTDMTDSGPNLLLNLVNAVAAVGAQPALQTQCVSEAVAAAWGPPTFQAPPSQPSTALHDSTAPAALGAPPSQVRMPLQAITAQQVIQALHLPLWAPHQVRVPLQVITAQQVIPALHQPLQRVPHQVFRTMLVWVLMLQLPLRWSLEPC